MRLSNGSRLYRGGDDSLAELARAINNAFAWLRPTVISDSHYRAPWATVSSSPTLVAEYRVPVWPGGVGGEGSGGGDALRAQMFGRFTGGATTGVGSLIVTVDGVNGTGNEATAVPSGGLNEHDIDPFDVSDGGDWVRVQVHLQGSGANVIGVSDFRLEWEPFDVADGFLKDALSGRYGTYDRPNGVANLFLPNDVKHFETANNPASVERVRRLLRCLYELIVRRSPQPIVTWSNIFDPWLQPASPGSGPKQICRVQSLQLPHYNAVEVHAKLTGEPSVRVALGPWTGLLPANDTSEYAWVSTTIPVDPIRESFFVPRDFRVIDPDKNFRIQSLCAWWRML